MDARIRIVVVDDHPLFRDGVVHVLGDSGAFEVVGQASSGAEALELVTLHQPDVMLLDVKLPGGGLDLVRSLQASHARTKVVFLTVVDDRDFVASAFREGVRGYLLKGSGADELIAAAKGVARGEICVSPLLLGQLLGRLSQSEIVAADGPDPEARLSEREEQVLSLVSHGMSNKEIAYRLSLSEKTVKYYLTHVLRKLRMRNRVEAALYGSQRAAPQRSAPAYPGE